MKGCVIPNTPIAVDIWNILECLEARVFLLTHLHGRYVKGKENPTCPSGVEVNDIF